MFRGAYRPNASDPLGIAGSIPSSWGTCYQAGAVRSEAQGVHRGSPVTGSCPLRGRGKCWERCSDGADGADGGSNIQQTRTRTLAASSIVDSFVESICWFLTCLKPIKIATTWGIPQFLDRSTYQRWSYNIIYVPSIPIQSLWLCNFPIFMVGNPPSLLLIPHAWRQGLMLKDPQVSSSFTICYA